MGDRPSLTKSTPRPTTVIIGGCLGALWALLADTLGLLQFAPGTVSPWILLSTATGAALGFFWTNTLLAIVDTALLVCYATVAFSPLAQRLVDSWARNDPLPSRSVDAIIALSSAVRADTALDGVATERLLSALELAHGGAAPRLVTTRVASASGSLAESDADQARLVKWAAPLVEWITVGPVASTRDEAVQSANALMGRGLRTVIVVTSPSHTRRACQAFERTGFRVYCRPARERTQVTWRVRSSGARLAAFRLYLYERAAILHYRRHGWV